MLLELFPEVWWALPLSLMSSKLLQHPISGLNLVPKMSDDEIEVSGQGDGSCGITGIGDGARITNTTIKLVTPVLLRYQIDHRTRFIAKNPLTGDGYCAAHTTGDVNAVLSSKTRLATCHPYS